MRLINAETLDVHEFYETDVPKYAILSHTWGDNEVSLQQFIQHESTTEAKDGYSKIKHMCEQTLKYGLRYAWVDTCCIDKTSSAELSEAINSMFRWYEAAEVCFAYLADVSPIQGGSYALFRVSRWFTRGWTLQELLAPCILEFFASDWTFIANRSHIADLVRDITGIDEVYLTGSIQGTCHNLLRKASIAERMSWASQRKTTRKEDIAYSLLGIFDVNIPLIYGEGDMAFQRLQEEILRSSFDPTLLAWHIGAPFQPSGFKASSSKSSWGLALGIISGFDHPWNSNLKASSYGRPMGFLAPNPSYFSRCKDLVSFGSGLDWTLTSQGLEITLPFSQGTVAPEDWVRSDPYALVPCGLRHDPWTLLALPVIGHAGIGYSRSDSSATTVSHHTWHQWPHKRLLLRRKESSSRANLENPAYFHPRLWIKSIPQTLRLLHIYSSDGWSPGERLIHVLQPTSVYYPFGDGLAGLLFELKETDEVFAIIIRVFRSVPLTFISRLLKDGSDILRSESVQFRYLRPSSRESLQSLLRSSSQTTSFPILPNYLEVQGSILNISVDQQYLMDSTVLTIDIQQTHRYYTAFMLRFKYVYLPKVDKQFRTISTTVSTQMETLHSFLPARGLRTLVWQEVRPTRMSVDRPSQILLLLLVITMISTEELGRFAGRYSARIKCSEYSLWKIHLERWLDVTSFVGPKMLHGSSTIIVSYELAPIACCFAPRSSNFVRNKRWLFALFFGIIIICLPISHDRHEGFFIVWIWDLIREISPTRNTEFHFFDIFLLGLRLYIPLYLFLFRYILEEMELAGSPCRLGRTITAFAHSS